MEATNTPGTFPVANANLAAQIHQMHATSDGSERE